MAPALGLVPRERDDGRDLDHAGQQILLARVNEALDHSG